MFNKQYLDSRQYVDSIKTIWLLKIFFSEVKFTIDIGYLLVPI